MYMVIVAVMRAYLFYLIIKNSVRKEVKYVSAFQ